jgi:hypothetical protein
MTAAPWPGFDNEMDRQEIMAILQQAASKLGVDIARFPEGAHSIEIREDGWCGVGWLNCPRIDKTYDVWWHPDRHEGRQ